MAGGNAKHVGHLVVQAINQSNSRAIVTTGWGGVEIDDQQVNDNICVIDAAPHDWLFPQVSAVVHHGGAGSTAAGLKAGKPTLICPFSMDQPFWGARVEALHVGLKAIYQSQLTVKNLAAALVELKNDQVIINNAKAIGEKISSEDGIQTAIDIIEQTTLSHYHA